MYFLFLNPENIIDLLNDNNIKTLAELTKALSWANIFSFILFISFIMGCCVGVMVGIIFGVITGDTDKAEKVIGGASVIAIIALTITLAIFNGRDSKYLKEACKRATIELNRIKYNTEYKNVNSAENDKYFTIEDIDLHDTNSSAIRYSGTVAVISIYETRLFVDKNTCIIGAEINGNYYLYPNSICYSEDIDSGKVKPEEVSTATGKSRKKNKKPRGYR